MDISNYLKSEHRECDNIFAEAEKAVADKDFTKGEEAFLKFADETLLHFKKEEEEFFPAFEAVTGSSEGPTMVMRHEHEQVRGLLGKMAHAIEEQDRDAYLSLAESMMILLQQHNMKEEQMLYTMADRVIQGPQREELITKMEKVAL
jgi:hemerythrin-like domain-containing protein